MPAFDTYFSFSIVKSSLVLVKFMRVDHTVKSFVLRNRDFVTQEGSSKEALLLEGKESEHTHDFI